MAASRLIEEESGTYSGRIRHSHNGYYAGDFSQTPRSGSELRASDPGRRDAPRAWQWRRTDGANPSVDHPAAYLATSSVAPMPTT
jgi:hypothetical protein